LPSRRRAALTFSAVLALAASACGERAREATPEEIAPKEEVALARECLGHLRAGRLEEVERHLDPALLGTGTRARLEEAAREFPPGEPRSVELIGANVGKGPSPGSTAASLAFQSQHEQGWIAATVLLRRKDGGPPQVSGLHVRRLPDSLDRVHAFGLEGKGATQWLFLAGMVLVPALVIGTLIDCVRARGLRRSWGWIVFILVGVGAATVNWTTGQVSFAPLGVHVFGTAVTKSSPYSPWLLTVAFPLGAVAYLVARLRGGSRGAGAEEDGSGSDPPPG
jgi:hypothetical protein